MHFTDLNFDSYDEYLQSNEWQEIRDMKFHSGDPYRCRICHSTKDLRLHKRTYYNLTAKFFYRLLKHERKLYQKILVYLCTRCNTLVHFYDGRKQKNKVPLDYLFLWEREQQIYLRADMVVVRFLRTTKRLIIWFRRSYHVRKRYLRRTYT